jgi:uncharacterized phage protein gp47/JayE
MIDIPKTFSEVVERLRNDFQSSIQDSNPFLRTGFLKSLLDSHAGRYLDLYRKTTTLINELFVYSASEVGLIQHGNEYGLTLLPAIKPQGSIIAIGTVGEVISSGTEFVSKTGDIFISTASATVTSDILNISLLTQNNGVATATSVDHKLATGVSVTISGASQTGYNGIFEIEVTSKDTFTYSVDSSTPTPATGAITASIDRAIIFIEATVGGIGGNLSPNEKLDFVSTLININSETAVIHPGLTGGKNEEGLSEFRGRLQNFKRCPVSPFNANSIKKTIQEAVPTATRIFINPTTPGTGQTTIYFVEDGQSNIIPSSATLAKAKNALTDIITANIDIQDVFVYAPTLVSVNFAFSSITPNTQTMREAIISNLDYLFLTTKEGVDILEEDFLNAIINTVDTAAGAQLESFNLASPIGGVPISAGQLGVLGNVTF